MTTHREVKGKAKSDRIRLLERSAQALSFVIGLPRGILKFFPLFSCGGLRSVAVVVAVPSDKTFSKNKTPYEDNDQGRLLQIQVILYQR